MLVKVVQVDVDGALPGQITYRTNNQNSVDIRDQRSRDPVQRDLQAQVAAKYGGTFGFRIRRGERVAATEVLTNETAAQFIMAVYVREPWAAVRKVALFDDAYRRIFNREVDADRLYLMNVFVNAVSAERARLRPDLASSFSSIRFTLAYLVAETLRETEQGRTLLREPGRFLPDLRREVEAALSGLAGEAAESTNLYVQNEEAEAAERGTIFDPKVAFKSRSGVVRLAGEVGRMGRRVAMRDPNYFFTIEPVR